MKLPQCLIRPVLLAVSVLLLISCQTLPRESLTSAPPPISPVPEPYTKDEFPSWAKDLRRAEIVTLGSIPFTVLGVNLGYGLYRYINSGFDSAYTPNPFAKSSDSAGLSTNEQIGVIAAAAGISVALGITDFIISTVKRKNEEKKRAQKEADGSVIRVEPYKQALPPGNEAAAPPGAIPAAP